MTFVIKTSGSKSLEGGVKAISTIHGLQLMEPYQVSIVYIRKD